MDSQNKRDNNFIKGLKFATVGMGAAAMVAGCGVDTRQTQTPAPQESKQLSKEEVIEEIRVNNSEFKELENEIANEEFLLDSESNMNTINKKIQMVEKDNLRILKVKFAKIMDMEEAYKSIQVNYKYDRDGKELQYIEFKDIRGFRDPVKIEGDSLESCPELGEYINALSKLQANKDGYAGYSRFTDGKPRDSDTMKKIAGRALTLIECTENLLNKEYTMFGKTLQVKEIGTEGDIVVDGVVIGTIKAGIDTNESVIGDEIEH